MSQHELTLRGCRLPGFNGLFDVALAGGHIAAITPAAHAATIDAATIDAAAATATAAAAAAAAGSSLALEGRLLLPALADGHLHLDKSFIGLPWRPHVAGEGIAARIAAERSERAALEGPLQQRARLLLERVIEYGTLAVRSHVDVDELIGLAHVTALLELRAALRGRIDLQLAVFPQSGISPRVAELLEEALRLGVEVIGGLDPAGIDGDIEAHLDVVFGLAERYGCRIDIHLHDPGTLGTFELRRIAARSAALGLQGRVAVSHAFALGMVDAPELHSTVQALARGGVAIMSSGPGADAMPPLRALLDAGVLIFGGSDNIRDAWSPFGSGDLLQRAGMIGYRANFRSDAELRQVFEFVSSNSRRVMGLPPLALTVGSAADLVALNAADLPEAVAAAPAERLVFRSGLLVHPLQ
jgi:cytosine/adenosine deaminase-related metal-dependent hydrolase